MGSLWVFLLKFIPELDKWLASQHVNQHWLCESQE